MNQQHADNTAKFTSIDDIINFYTQTLQHSDSPDKDLVKEEHRTLRNSKA
jgi:hypothetical protein